MKLDFTNESRGFSELKKYLQHTGLIPAGFECEVVSLSLRRSSQVEDESLGTRDQQPKKGKYPGHSEFVHNLIADRELRLERLLEKQQIDSGSCVQP